LQRIKITLKKTKAGKGLVMEYMIRFTQVHETFRLAEIEALAVLEEIDLTVISYKPDVSYIICISS